MRALLLARKRREPRSDDGGLHWLCRLLCCRFALRLAVPIALKRNGPAYPRLRFSLLFIGVAAVAVRGRHSAVRLLRDASATR